MKLRRSDVRRQVHVLPILNFESQSLTSYAGLVLFQQLLAEPDIIDGHYDIHWLETWLEAHGEG